MLTYDVKWTEVAQLGATALGFLTVIYQMWRVGRSTAGNTYASLYGEYMDVCKLFLEKPRLRPYFYNSATVSADISADDPIRTEIETVCELMTGLLEHAALQKVNIPRHIWKECWEKYTNERYNDSPAMRSYWERNKHLYAEKFCIVVATRKGAAQTSPS
jgi:hypothetical protein